MKVAPAIFRSYDIRGIYPDELNETTAEQIGKALGTFGIRKGWKSAVVGQDDRASSPALSKSFIRGLAGTGFTVTDVGITLTPIIHFLTCIKKFDLGVNITASHNPKHYNGFRIDKKDAWSFYGEDIWRLADLINRQDFEKGEGSVRGVDMSDYYFEVFKEEFNFKTDLKVILDCGQGASSAFAPKIFNTLGCGVVPVYCNLDSTFPGGIPDPENLMFMQDLRQKVLENRADVGFGFDTDGDRFGVVDERGTIYENDKLLLLFAEDILTTHKGATVVYDIKCSESVNKVIKDLGGVPKVLRTGHPYFMEEMKKGALLGCELSGHTFFGDKYFGFDDGIYAACRVLEIMHKTKRPLSSLMARYPKSYHTKEVKITCSDAKKFDIVDGIKDAVSRTSLYTKVLLIDGVKAYMSDTGWFLIRASNTSPYLSIRLEGISLEEVQRIRAHLKNLLKGRDLDFSPLNCAKVFYA